jgi:arginine deiminase
MQPIQLSVFSETARLRQVVVHNPGPEVDQMVPGMMEKLLFDDILYGDLARHEHAQFRQVLAKVADEVLDVQDLFIEALQDEGVKLGFIEDLRRLVGLPDDTCNLLREMDQADAARSVIAGVPWEDMPSHTRWEEEFDYRVRPIPNLLFMRDPAAVLGDGYVVSSMATWARERESLILSYVFRHHPRLRHHTDQDKWFDQVTPLIRGEIKAPVSLEGGDILVLSRKVLVVGCSARTQADAIHLLAESLRAHRAGDESSFDHLLMVLMPKKRSAMHLDTIFTRTSEHECLIYPPYFLEGSRELLNVTSIDLRHAELRMSTQPSLLKSLKAVGIELDPIFCGGQDSILQQREQWTDGANAFCLAPGVIAGYGRNLATGAALDQAGYRVVTTAQVLTDANLNLLDGTKYLVQIEASELSRARGGPRCMTMPLSRESLRG